MGLTWYIFWYTTCLAGKVKLTSSHRWKDRSTDQKLNLHAAKGIPLGLAPPNACCTPYLSHPSTAEQNRGPSRGERSGIRVLCTPRKVSICEQCQRNEAQWEAPCSAGVTPYPPTLFRLRCWSGGRKRKKILDEKHVHLFHHLFNQVLTLILKPVAMD